MKKTIVLISLVFLISGVNGSVTTDKFLTRSHTTSDGTLPYRLFVPANYSSQTKYPLILTLHGAGERGTDNTYHITKNRLAEVWGEDSTQAKQKCFVVSPQCPSNRKWVEVAAWTDIFYSTKSIAISIPLKITLSLLDSLKREFSIDTNRMYVAGLSMGGYGTWDLISRYPEMFAAAIPQSGGCDTSKHSTVKNIPIWVFHGAKDATVPPQADDSMIVKLKNKDGVAVVQYTTQYASYFTNSTITRANLKSSIESGKKILYCSYTDASHDIWSKSFNEPLLAQWLFLQKKTMIVNNFPSQVNQPVLGPNTMRSLLMPEGTFTAIAQNMISGAPYSVKVFDAKGALCAQTVVGTIVQLKAFGRTVQKKTTGLRLVEVNRLSQ